MNSSSSAGSQLKRSNRAIWISGLTVLFLILAVSTYAWTLLQHSCSISAVQEASARLIRQRDSYDHAYQFATSVSQNAVVRPVADLQQILMDTQDIDVPACLQSAKEELVHYMGAVIRAFLAYGAREPDTAVRSLLDQSNVHYENFNTEVKTISECAPFCLP